MSFGSAGILDYHLRVVIEQGWRTIYANSKPNFVKLFPAVASTVLDEWFAALTNPDHPLRIILEGSRGAPSVPSVVIRLDDESMSERPMGTKWKIGGDYTHPFIVRQQAILEYRAATPETLRALAVVMRAILTLARDHMCNPNEAGYLEFTYDGGGGLTPEEQYIAEQGGLGQMCLWRARYSALAPIGVPDPVAVDVAFDWFVQAKDIKLPDGNTGGVTPIEGA